MNSSAILARAAVCVLLLGRLQAGASEANLIAGMPSETASRILALQSDSISDSDVTAVLAHAPAPRVLCFQGSPAFVTMSPFAKFLRAMGYPDAALRNPHDRELSYSGRLDTDQVAGMVGWYYEHDAMMPMLIGHSRGGLLVIRTLHRLAEPTQPVKVWNPLSNEVESRTTIRDPFTGEERPVVGLRLSYAAVLATGKLARLLLGQWSDMSRLRKIPDSVTEFTGFQIRWDLIAGSTSNPQPYRAIKSAQVRNVTLSADVSHIFLPRAQHLAEHPEIRAWISTYVPGTSTPPPRVPGLDTSNILHAADIWFSLKKHWCLEAQRLIRERWRAATEAS
jgi:hypothetical protein